VCRLVIRRKHYPELGGISGVLVSVVHRRFEQQAVAITKFAASREIQFSTPVSTQGLRREVMIHAGKTPLTSLVFNRGVKIIDAGTWCCQELVRPTLEGVQRCQRRYEGGTTNIIAQVAPRLKYSAS